MDEQLAQRFEEQRSRLRSVAHRMLGSVHEADDAVQEAWLRLDRADAATIDHLDAWLTTVVSRIALDVLRRRATRREDRWTDEAVASTGDAPDPIDDVELADSVGAALLVVLDTLTPAERLAFVLHDLFAVPFDQIGGVLGRSTAASKMLASRARRRVQVSESPARPDPMRQRPVVEAFLAASRDGDLGGLIAILHPDIVLDADAGAVAMGAPAAVVGADGVAGMFAGRALGAEPAVLDDEVGVAWIVAGRPKVVWHVIVDDGRIVHLDMVASNEQLEVLTVATVR